MFDKNPICPYCDHEEHDPEEIDFGASPEGQTFISCKCCGEDYFCYRNVCVNYTTYKLEELDSIRTID